MSAPARLLAGCATLCSAAVAGTAWAAEGTALPADERHASVSMPAFPGAVGYGRYTAGGRGGQVVIVTTLDDVVDPDDEHVSLREALEQYEQPRTIVFEVGGLFDTGEERLQMGGESGSHVTVACQSAPAPGVNIKGAGLRIDDGAHDLIMRHCAFRNIDPGMPHAESSRGIGVIANGHPSARMIFDHVSSSWATDETWTVFAGPETEASSRDFTLSNSILAEGDADSAHPESGLLPNRYMHSMGPSCNSKSQRYPVTGCSIVANLMAHNGRRNPLFWGAVGEISDNLVYNWYETAVSAQPHNSQTLDVQVLRNHFRTGPTTKRDRVPVTVILDDGPVDVAVEGNRYQRFENGVVQRQEAIPDLHVGKPSPPPSPAVTLDLDCVGASRPERDSLDARIVQETRNGTGMTGIGDEHERVFPAYASSRRVASFDTDRDGIADEWERRHDLDPADPADSLLDADGNGYTDIEDYVNDLATC